MLKKLLCLLLFCSCRPVVDEKEYDQLPIIPEITLAKPTSARLAHVFYLVQHNQIEKAIDIVLEAQKEDPYLFHSGILDRLGLTILEQGLASVNEQERLASLYGIGITQDDRAIPLIQKALTSENPQEELIALFVLAHFDQEETDLLLEQAMKSNYLFVRLEAAYILAAKKRPHAYAEIEALMHKIDPEFRHLFPKLFAIEGGPQSSEMLKKLLFDHDIHVRLEAISACSEFGRDDFLEEIRRLSLDPDPLQLEAACHALGKFKDEASIEQLEAVVKTNTGSVHNTARLAAYNALFELGDKDLVQEIYEEARAGNLFAVQLLATVPESTQFLLALQEHDDISLRVNATIALLKKRHDGCLKGLPAILLDSPQDYTLQPISSLGHSFDAYRVISSSSQNLTNTPSFFELSLRIREQILTETQKLSQKSFLEIARLILQSNQKDLIPTCVRLLEHDRTEGAIALLKEEEQKFGAPYVRAWCRLALFRLDEEGPYAEAIKTMLAEKGETAFQPRPALPWGMRLEESSHTLTLEESAQLMLESYQAIAEKQNVEAIRLLLTAIRDGNKLNRYLLSALLMRSAL